MSVPEVLTNGNHKLIDEWQQKESLRRTLERRPDMLEKVVLTEQQEKWLEELRNEKKKGK